MNVELELTTLETCRPIRNLYPLYLQELASYERLVPNPHGVLSQEADVETWEQLLDRNSAWWKNPELLFPYLIRADGVPAGFNLIAKGPYVPTAGIDVVQHEFFVVHAFRGQDVALRAFQAGLEQHPGRWEICTWPTAPRAQAFWRKALRTSVPGEVRETEEDHPWGRRVAWRFEQSAG